MRRLCSRWLRLRRLRLCLWRRRTGLAGMLLRRLAVPARLAVASRLLAVSALLLVSALLAVSGRLLVLLRRRRLRLVRSEVAFVLPVLSSLLGVLVVATRRRSVLLGVVVIAA